VLVGNVVLGLEIDFGIVVSAVNIDVFGKTREVGRNVGISCSTSRAPNGVKE